MKSQLTLLSETDWDVLIVLDACRWDFWNDLYSVGEPTKSDASCTRDWVLSIKDNLDWSDVFAVTANPVVTYYGDFLRDIDDVGARAHQRVNGVPTVPPKYVSNSLKSQVVLGDGRVYGHYVQPHGPYPWSDPPLYLHRTRPESEDMVEPGSVIGKGISSVPELFETNDDVTWETIREGYRRNLEWVYDSVIDFAESIESNVVITSDHGEYLGENGQYGHNCEYDSDIVRVVPWYEL